MAYGQNMNAPMSGLMSLAAMKGRMGDNTLVHVNPMELKALDAMAPGGLTKNPTTGLPEAFKLKDALPILLGIAAPFALPALGIGGAAAGSALTGAAGAAAAGAGAATGTALAGGNKEEILTSGLLTGATAGLLGGFGGGAEKAVTDVGAKGITDATTQAATQSITGGGIANMGSLVPTIGGQTAGQTAAQATTQAAAQAAPQGFLTNLASGAVPDLVGGTTGKVLTEAGREAALKSIAGTVGGAGLGGLAASGLTVDMPETPGYERPREVTIQERTPTMTPEQQQAEVDRYIRQGGATPTFFSYSPAQVGYPYTYAEEGGSLSETPVAQGEMFSGMVRDNGNGDGMSDNVEFKVVGDPEIGRAMLSPDEYVMDAYTVAALGNGSADAGADKLDRFREELRQKVYGSKEQPNEINGAKELSKLA